MILSINAEKNTQKHSFMIKRKLRKIEIEENFLNLINSIVLISQDCCNHNLGDLKPEIYHL